MPLATQLSATPPARQRFFISVSAASARVRRSTTSSVTAWIDAARSIWRWVSSSSGFARGAAEQRVEARISHRQPGAIVEIIEDRDGTSRPPSVDQMIEDGLGVFRLAIGRESHDLVFAGIDLEAGVIGESRIEQAERMRKVDFLLDRQLRCRARCPRKSSPIRRRRPW